MIDRKQGLKIAGEKWILKIYCGKWRLKYGFQ